MSEHETNQAVTTIHPLLEEANGKYSIKEPVSIDQLFELMTGLLEQEFKRHDQLTSPEATRRFLLGKISRKEHEVFGVVHLDNSHHVIEYEILFRGTVDSCSIYPREILKRVLQINSSALILFHNHPSFAKEPSQADIRITTRLKEALSLIEVRILDHILIAGTESISFAEKGLL